MSIKLKKDDPGKAVQKFFAEELPAVGVETSRDIYKAVWEIAWPMPPQPIREGQFIRWREYVSPVIWASIDVDLLIQLGGEKLVREVVLSCRVQEQANRLMCDLRAAVSPDEVEQE